MLTRRQASLVLVAMWAAVFGPIITHDVAFFYRDQLVTNMPVRAYWHERLMLGELPEWLPYEGLGVPFFGQVATGHFHPGVWLFAWLDAVTAARVAIPLTYLFGAVGVYRLARAFVASRLASVTAAIAITYGGFTIGTSNNTLNVLSQATLPWAFLFAQRFVTSERREHLALFSLSWAAVFFAGDAQLFLLFPLVMLAAWMASPKRLTFWLFGLAGVITSLMVCVELLPGWELAKDSVRSLGHPSPTLMRTFAVHPLRLLELVLSGFVPDEVRWVVVRQIFSQNVSAMFTTTMFAGVTTLGLACAGVSKRSAWLVGVAVFALWMSMGDYTFGLPLAQRVLPLLQRFRYPEKYLGLFWLMLGPLVALGVDRLGESRKRLQVYSSLVVGLAVLLPWLVQRVSSDPKLRDVLLNAWRSAAIAGVAFACALLLLAWQAERRAQALLVVPALVAIELIGAHAAHVPVVDAAMLREPHQRLSDRVYAAKVPDVPLTVSGDDHEAWVRHRVALLQPDVNVLFKQPALGENLGQSTFRHTLLFGPHADSVEKYASRFAGCHELSANQYGERLVKDVPCLPRARFLTAPVRAHSLGEAAKLTRSGEDAVEIADGATLGSGDGSIKWVQDEPEHITLEVEAESDATLFLADAYARGWTAQIDGKASTVHPALVAGRAVSVAKGNHVVQFHYQTPYLRLGAMLSALGFVMCAILYRSSKLRPSKISSAV